MYIELTDHLRCPEPHDESFLVLLPDLVAQRSVQSGTLGCPVCHRTFRIEGGVFDTGDAPAPAAEEPTMEPAALAALMGIAGPGGYVVLVGPVAARAGGLREILGEVSVVAVNGPASVVDAPGINIIRSGGLPLKSASMRAVVLSGNFGREDAWIADGARVLLPGLRVVGEGTEPALAGLEVLASAGGWWVGSRRRQ